MRLLALAILFVPARVAAEERVDITGLHVKWHANALAASTGAFDNFEPSVDLPNTQTFRKNWVGTIAITLDAFAGMYPEEFDVVVNVGAPGSLVNARVTKVKFHDTAALHGIESVTVEATVSLGRLVSEQCADISATIRPSDALRTPVQSNVVPLCLTSLPRMAKRTGKLFPGIGKRPRNDTIELAVAAGTPLETLRHMEVAARGKLALRSHFDGLALLVMHLRPHARDVAELEERISALRNFDEVIFADPDSVK